MWYTEKGPERAREKAEWGAVRGARRGREEKSLPRETRGVGRAAKRRCWSAVEQRRERGRGEEGERGRERGRSGGYRQWLRLIFPGSSRSSVVSTSYGNLLSLYVCTLSRSRSNPLPFQSPLPFPRSALRSIPSPSFHSEQTYRRVKISILYADQFLSINFFPCCARFTRRITYEHKFKNLSFVEKKEREREKFEASKQTLNNIP